MGHRDKRPFAPWSTRNPPVECGNDDCPADRADDACECDGRRKWGYRSHYVDGETIEMAEIDPQIDGRAFIQLEEDLYAYVDGDDMRCPETGEIHPVFIAFLEHLGSVRLRRHWTSSITAATSSRRRL